MVLRVSRIVWSMRTKEKSHKKKKKNRQGIHPFGSIL